MLKLSAIKPMAVDLGFYHVAVAPLKIPDSVIKKYDEFIAHGRQGGMAWLANNRAARLDPRHIFAPMRSILVLTHPYPFDDPLNEPATQPATAHDTQGVTAHDAQGVTAHDAQGVVARYAHGVVARYARGTDYHLLIKEKLARVQEWLRAQKIESRAITDSAPFFEKPTAAMAGIGWQGKHTNLLTRDLGNWFFLAELLLAVEVVDDTAGGDTAGVDAVATMGNAPANSSTSSAISTSSAPAPANSSGGSCGSCQACINACPTAAFPAPYQLDARKCISYLTIEHHGAIDKKFRRQIGDMIFGCDICLAVCPFNKFAATAKNLKQDGALRGAATLGIADILTMGQEEFAQRFALSPIKRLGLNRLQRNALIVLANYFYDGAGRGNGAARQYFLPQVLGLLRHDDAVVRGAAVWCLRAIDNATFAHEKEKFLPTEPNRDVREEWAEG